MKSPLGLVLRQAPSCLAAWFPLAPQPHPSRPVGRDPGRAAGEWGQPRARQPPLDLIWFLMQLPLAGRLTRGQAPMWAPGKGHSDGPSHWTIGARPSGHAERRAPDCLGGQGR